MDSFSLCYASVKKENYNSIMSHHENPDSANEQTRSVILNSTIYHYVNNHSTQNEFNNEIKGYQEYTLDRSARPNPAQ